MKMFHGKNLLVKLMTIIVTASIVPVAIVGYTSYRNTKDSLKTEMFNHLESVREAKHKQIASYFQQRMDHMRDVPQNMRFANGMPAFSEAFSSGLDSDEYRAVHEQRFSGLKIFKEAFGYYDVFLVDLQGNVVFTVEKEADFGENLVTGPLRDTGLGRAFQLGKKQAGIIDYEWYEPSNAPAGFMATPLKDSHGQLSGVAVFEVSLTQINEIATDRSGLGVTGETYLVGQDLLMRTDSRFSDSSTILREKVDTEAVRLAMEDKDGTLIIRDYRGELVLSSYSHLGLNEINGIDFEWAILCEINESEAFAPARKIKAQILWISVGAALIFAFIGFYVARGIARPILNGVNVLAASASEISATVSQIASSTSQTAAAVTEATTTAEEVRQAVQVSTDRTKVVSEGAENASQASQEGMEATTNSTEGMKKISDQMTSIADGIMGLSEQSQAIGDIITTVSDLAEQSNLLAVNASIEAAKAGEQGKGFAVVAQEIRGLAEQSKESTKQVRAILSDIQKATNNAVLATEQGGKAVEEGIDLSNRAGEAIVILTDSVQESSRATTQIVASSQQQMVGIEQVNGAMESIKVAVTQNVASTKQLSVAAHTLKEIGEGLRALVEGTVGTRNGNNRLSNGTHMIGNNELMRNGRGE